MGEKMHSLGKKHWVMDYSQNSGTGALPLAQQSEIKMKIAKAKGKISFSLEKKKKKWSVHALKPMEQSVHTRKFH